MSRMNRQDWLEMGLTILGQAGLEGLTIEAMAQTLDLTKGSFYHHFKNVQEFKGQLVAYWANQYLSTAANLPASPQERLRLLDTLMEETFSAITGPEIAIRLWAQEDDQARIFVEQVDAYRRGFVLAVFESAVSEGDKASLMADMLFTIAIGSMTAIPPLPADRVLALYQEFKGLYGL